VAVLDRPAPGELGSDTWPKPDDPDPKRANAWKVGGAAVWQTPAIDPNLGLIYFSTGNPGPEAGGMGRDRPGDNLFLGLDRGGDAGRKILLALPASASRPVGL